MSGWIAETLIASTALMVVVLLVRKPVRAHVDPRLAYALWALPALRMMLPPLPGAWRWSALWAPTFSRANDLPIVAGVLNPERMPPAVLDHAVMTTLGYGVRLAFVPPVVTDDGAPLLALLSGFWLLGAFVFLAHHLIRHHLFCRQILRGARRVRPIAEGRVHMIESTATSGPLAFGIRRKYVAFPADFAERYDAEERTLALAHELGHHARGDLLANWAALVVLALHWFNPVAWRAFRAFRADQEMANDARVLAGRAPALRHAYGRAIVKSAHGGALSAACHLHTINDVKGRLKMLTTTRKTRARLVTGALCAGVLTAAGLATTASGTQVPEAPPAPTAPLQVPVPPEPPLPDAVPVLPAPPIPPAPNDTFTSVDRSVTRTTGPDGETHRHERIITRGRNGTVRRQDFEGLEAALANIPEVSSGNCPVDLDAKQMVLDGTSGGKRTITICKNRIDRVAARAAETAMRAGDIQRTAYRQGLAGLRHARANAETDAALSAEKRQKALWAIDTAIKTMQVNLDRTS